MFNKFAIPLCAVALAATMAPVTADAMTFTYNGPAAGSFVGVNTNRTEAGGPNRNTQAGPFNMSQSAPADPLGDFIAWCFEIDENLVTAAGGTNSYSFGGVLDTDQRARVQKMFDANYDDATIETSQPKGAAFQLALWEVIYDDNFDLSAGDFKSSTGGNLRSFANEFLTVASGYTGPQKWVITELKSDSAQDLGTVNAIPLPAAAWLLLGVSGALVGAKRRSARKAA
jgi:hypothetical protein